MLHIWFLLPLCFFRGCIIPYEPDIGESADLVSIEGSIIKGQPVQSVLIARTTTVSYSKFHPMEDCRVVLQDDHENEYVYQEEGGGRYNLELPGDALVFGRKYRLQVTTPSGEQYGSRFEELREGAVVDTVYYQVEEKLDNLTGEETFGLQFYIDLKASDSISRYFRWNLEETYEYTSIAPVTYYLTGDSVIFPQDPFEVYRCWKTLKVNQLFLSNTVNLTLNEKKRIPLNYVSTQTDRLKYKYSLLVWQYTLSEGAYNYWQKKKNETQESGGLYTQQPGQPITNLYDVNDTTRQLLGYFWVSHMTGKRILVPRIHSMPVVGDYCEMVEFDPIVHGKGPFPRYIWVDDLTGIKWTGNNICFNCTFKGGSVKKPPFWE